MFNALLQVLDDGRLTDGKGRTVDFRNVVLLMTSNLGATHILDPTMSRDAVRGAVLADVRTFFRPEFLNRIDETVIFDRLDREELAQIVDVQLGRLRRRIADHDLDLQVTDEARAWLAERGYDPVYGARPLQRVLRHEVENRLARALIDGTVTDGDVVVVDTDTDDALTLRRATD